MYRLALALGAALLLGACGSSEAPAPARTSEPEGQEPSPFQNVGADVRFAGDAACFDCHEDLWRSYQAHGMAQSFYPLTPENAVEDFSGQALFHEGSEFYYRPYREGDRFFQEEYRLDEAGQKTHRLVREMTYVVGSGSAARTYLAEEGGRLYELPITWYTQAEGGAGTWDFSPGYEVQNGRFSRLIPDRCMSCHNAVPETVPFAEGKYTDVPQGIGCERCHGPGEAHVESRLAEAEAPDSIDYTIVNPAHLDLDRRLDVCQQCHLQTTISVLRENRGPYSFRPSEDLARHVAFFATDEPRSTTSVSVISHADRIKASACFLATAETPKAMDCVTCHNPHEGFRDQGPAYFNATCLDCHDAPALQQTVAADVQAEHAADANCIACHMPKVEAEDAPHASFTDHWIRVVGEETDVEGEGETDVEASGPVELVPYFERDEAGPEADVYRGIAYVVYGRQKGDREAMRTGVEILDGALARTSDHGEAQFLLGWARTQLGETAAGIPALERAVELDPGIPERLNALALAYEAEGRDPATIERLYERALQIQPALADVRVNYGRFLETRGRLDEALTVYQDAATEQPWLEEAHYNLGTALLQSGRPDEAEAALGRALELQPLYPEALGNLGLLYAIGGRPSEAERLFERAVEVAPESATALGNLGTFYLNQNRIDEAIRLLGQAVEADPRYLDGLVNLALAYFQRDDVAQARTYAQRALDVDPGNAKAQQILAAL